MISFGSIFGGPELHDSPIADTIHAIRLLMKKTRDLEDEGAYGSLNIVFHVPGSILQPEFEVLRTGRFSRKEKMLMIQIAVPAEQRSSPDLVFLLDAIREAIGMGRARFERAGIPYPEREYLATVDGIEKELTGAKHLGDRNPELSAPSPNAERKRRQPGRLNRSSSKDSGLTKTGMPDGPPQTVAINHDDYHAEYVGHTTDGHGSLPFRRRRKADRGTARPPWAAVHA